jgi:POT family proton-dependent oligopeptide transporter
MNFLLLVNLGSMSSAVTTTIEQSLGFTAAFCVPAVTFIMGFAVLLSRRHTYTERPPAGSIILNALRILGIAIRNGQDLDAARPSRQRASSPPLPWTDSLVDEVRAALSACKLFAFFPFFWAAYSQMLTNFISQAATMETSGVPNDILVNLDPLTIIVFIPVLEFIVFPLLRRLDIEIRPMARIVLGFALASLGLAYAAMVQGVIYASPPCFEHPRSKDLPRRIAPQPGPRDGPDTGLHPDWAF